MNECDWYAAETEDRATQELCYQMSCTVDEAKAEGYIVLPIVELNEQELELLRFQDTNEDGEAIAQVTFRQELDRRINEGQRFPQLFASTEY